MPPKISPLCSQADLRSLGLAVIQKAQVDARSGYPDAIEFLETGGGVWADIAGLSHEVVRDLLKVGERKKNNNRGLFIAA